MGRCCFPGLNHLYWEKKRSLLFPRQVQFQTHLDDLREKTNRTGEEWRRRDDFHGARPAFPDSLPRERQQMKSFEERGQRN